MTQKISFRFYNDQEIRAVWDAVDNQWWFAVVDIVGAVSGSVDAHNEIVDSTASGLRMLEDRGNGDYLYGCQVVCSRSGRFGITARIKAAGTEWDNSVPGFMCWPK